MKTFWKYFFKSSDRQILLSVVIYIPPCLVNHQHISLILVIYAGVFEINIFLNNLKNNIYLSKTQQKMSSTYKTLMITKHYHSSIQIN